MFFRYCSSTRCSRITSRNHKIPVRCVALVAVNIHLSIYPRQHSSLILLSKDKNKNNIDWGYES